MALLDDNTQSETTENSKKSSLIDSAVTMLDDLLNTQNSVTALMGEVEKKTRVSKRAQFLGVVSFSLFYLALGQAAAFLSNIVILAFPFYASVRSLEMVKNSAGEVKWLMYWIVFAFVSFVEGFISWVPTYYLFKVLLLLWCMTPGRSNGAHVIYHRIIRPLVMEHRDTVDTAISKMAKTVRREAEKAAEDYRPERKIDLKANILFAIKQVGHLRGFSDDEGEDTATKME